MVLPSVPVGSEAGPATKTLTALDSTMLPHSGTKTIAPHMDLLAGPRGAQVVRDPPFTTCCVTHLPLQAISKPAL